MASCYYEGGISLPVGLLLAHKSLQIGKTKDSWYLA